MPIIARRVHVKKPSDLEQEQKKEEEASEVRNENL